jgi:glutamyl-tRNA synthetase
LVFLGWNPGDERELFTLEELVEAFSVERIGKSGTKFDIAKAKWYNEQYLRSKPTAELAGYLIAEAKKEGVAIPSDKINSIVNLVKDRATFPADLWKESKFMVVAPGSFDEEIASKKWNTDAVKVLSAYAVALESFSGEFDLVSAKALLESTAETEGIKLGKVMQAVRLAVTGSGAGPDLMVVFAILGPVEVAKRIRFALSTLTVVA